MFRKLAYFLRTIQASRANNSIIFRIKNAKFSGYCFYMDTIICREIFKSALVYLQCISVAVKIHATFKS